MPEYSRPRDGRPVTGVATARGNAPPPGNGGGNPIIVYPYDPWGYWGGAWLRPGICTTTRSRTALATAPYGYGGYGGGYGYSGGGGSGGYGVSQSYHETGSLRLKIDPKQAQVYVDGYYVGVIDSFDGAFQKLEIDGGGHKIELKAEGFEPLTFDVLITPGETVTYKGDLKKIR